MRYATCLLVCIAVLLLPTLLLAADPGAQAGATIVPSDWQSLHDRWQAAAKELNIPGLAIVAVKGDQVVLLDAIGVCDPEGKQPVTPRSPFYLASVTKSFTAMGVAVLVDEEKVKLDEPVKTYLPRFTLADKDLADRITVRDLLCHRYGLDSSPISMAEAYFGNITDDRYYALLAFVEPQGEFVYSNLHFTLAGRIIEAVTGQKWQDFLAERVFAPLEMRDSTCYASQLYANPMAAWPIVEQNGAWKRAPVVKNDAVMHAAGGMGASATDLGNWLRFQITGKTPKGKELISPELLRDVQTRQVEYEESDGPAGINRNGYSLGWFTGNALGHPFLEHGGGYIGTATQVSFLPEQNVGVAVLMNESAPNAQFLMVVTTDVYGKLLGASFPDLLPEAKQSTARIRQRMAQRVELPWNGFAKGAGLSQPLASYAGTYAHPFWGDLEIAPVDGQLRFRVGDLTLRTHGLGDDHFRMDLLGEALEGTFRLDGSQTVTGLTIETPDGDAEFSKTK